MKIPRDSWLFLPEETIEKYKQGHCDDEPEAGFELQELQGKAPCEEPRSLIGFYLLPGTFKKLCYMSIQFEPQNKDFLTDSFFYEVAFACEFYVNESEGPDGGFTTFDAIRKLDLYEARLLLTALVRILRSRRDERLSQDLIQCWSLFLTVVLSRIKRWTDKRTELKLYFKGIAALAKIASNEPFSDRAYRIRAQRRRERLTGS